MKVFYIVLNLHLLVLLCYGIYGSFGDTDCIFGQSDVCSLPCRCLVNTDGGCNKTTGLCDHDNQSCLMAEPSETWIGHDWSGLKCQTGNVAYRKTAYLKDGDLLNQHDELTDGYLSGDSCLALGNNTDLPNTVLILDLGRKHKLTSVQLFLSGENDDVTVGVGNDLETDVENYIQCGQTASDSFKQVIISCLSVGQYISIAIANTGLTVCEIIVKGHIYNNVDCSNCNGECHSNMYCESCEAGFQPPGCNQDCPDGTYGYNCQNNCGNCRNGELCDKVTGNCANGCETWYIHPGTCDIYIGVTEVVHNIVRPSLKTKTHNLLGIAIYRFRIYNPDATWNYFFRVEYAAIHEEYKTTNEQIYEGEIGIYGYLVHIYHLQPNTLYYVRVVAYRVWADEEEFIGYSNPTVMQTQCTGPSPPILQVESLQEDEILISWQNFSSGCLSIKSTELFYTVTEGNGTFLLSKYIFGTVYSISLDVNKDQKYYLKLRVTNNNDIQSESEVFLYDPTTSKKEDKASEKTSCDDIPVYVFGLICVVVVLLLTIIVMFLCRIKTCMTKNDDHGANEYLEAVPSTRYRGNSEDYTGSTHPYDAVL